MAKLQERMGIFLLESQEASLGLAFLKHVLFGSNSNSLPNSVGCGTKENQRKENYTRTLVHLETGAGLSQDMTSLKNGSVSPLLFAPI